MQKENIHTDQAPGAIGPYVQAVKVGELIYTAGQGGLIPETGEMIEGDVQAQTEQAMKNLSAVLEAAGSDLDHVVKTNIYLRYIKDFDAMNEIYAGFFEGTFPARTTVATSALPMAALVEIEMVALVIEPDVEEPAAAEVAEIAATGEEAEAKAESKAPKKKKKPKAKKSSKRKKGKKKK